MKELFDALRVKEAAAEGFEAFGRGSLYALEKLESEVFGVEAAVAELQARERALGDSSCALRATARYPARRRCAAAKDWARSMACVFGDQGKG